MEKIVYGLDCLLSMTFFPLFFIFTNANTVPMFQLPLTEIMSMFLFYVKLAVYRLPIYCPLLVSSAVHGTLALSTVTHVDNNCFKLKTSTNIFFKERNYALYAIYMSLTTPYLADNINNKSHEFRRVLDSTAQTLCVTES